MSVAVLVPWAGKCPHRLAAWRHVQSWYSENYPDWQLVVGEIKAGQWCKAEAVADAIKETNAEILVVADADCIVPGVGDAVKQAEEGSPWAMPHFKVHRLSREATNRVLSGDEPDRVPVDRKHYSQQPYIGYPGGGVTVVRRETYLSTPLDPRFRGWGQEDESWALALTVMYGKPWRTKKSPLWHLWHPPQQRLTRVTGSHASRELLQQYKRATSQRGMKRLLEPAVDSVREAMAMNTSV